MIKRRIPDSFDFDAVTVFSALESWAKQNGISPYGLEGRVLFVGGSPSGAQLLDLKGRITPLLSTINDL